MSENCQLKIVLQMQHKCASESFVSAPGAKVLYGIQPIRPCTTSDSSRNIFGRALERAEGKRDAVELVSSYQFENSAPAPRRECL